MGWGGGSNSQSGPKIFKPSHSKPPTSAIKNAERPVTKKQVRSFLGLVGWYRRFIPNFSERAFTITDLTKKDKPNKVNWTQDCERAFQDLKNSLCTEPVLKSPDFEKTFTV